MRSKEQINFEALQFLGLTATYEHVKLSADLNSGFSFSANSDGSMQFESAFLSEGFRTGMNNKTAIFISEEEIRKSILNPINRDFPVKFNHDYDSPSPGIVNKIYFDEEKKMLMGVGKINVPEVGNAIRKLQAEKTIETSVTVFGRVVWNKEKARPELINLRYNELSIVDKGENPDTFIRVI